MAQSSPAPQRGSLPPRGRAYSAAGVPAALRLANNGDGGTNGVTVTVNNSGGASGNAWTAVTIGASATLTYDTTHAAHGGLAYSVTTPVSATTAFVSWGSPLVGAQKTLWFRQYLFIAANPGVNCRVIQFLNGGTLTAAVLLLTTGALRFVNTAGSTVLTTTATVPTGSWFRIEGFVTGDPSLGQVSLSLYKSPDAQVPTETDTSAATQNTFGPSNLVRFGVGAAVSSISYWMDDLAVSNTGPLGPASLVAAPSAGFPARVRNPPPQPRAGRVTSNAGAPVRNPVPGPPVYPLPGPVRARLPQLAPRAGRVTSGAGNPVTSPPRFPPLRRPVQARIPMRPPGGRVAGNRGAPVRNPVSGPVTYPLPGPVAARFPPLQPRAGRVTSSPGAPLANPQPGPVFRQAVQPCRARIPHRPAGGRITSGPGAPVANPRPGPVFRQATAPCRAPYPPPHPRAGRTASGPGAPLANPGHGPPFRQAPQPCRAPYPPLRPRAGRAAGNPGAPVTRPTIGVPFPARQGPVQARRPLPPRGRCMGQQGTFTPPVLRPGVVAVAAANPVLVAIASPSPAVVAVAPSGAGAAKVTVTTA